MTKRAMALLLVFAQFTLLFFLIAYTSGKILPPHSVFFFLLSFILASWSVSVMMKSKLRVTPVPAKDARLVADGPYRFIRHPMYTSVLLAVSGLLIIHFSYFRLLLAVFLLVVLLLKLNWEEKMLSEKFTDYRKYKQLTRKLIPFIY